MEYIRNLHSNYLRKQLSEKPEERSYRYRILSRGGISGLLSCELRYLNENAYLYYDITSKQSVAQLFFKKTIDREWLKDFMQFLQSLYRELDRFLLDGQDCVWNPEYIFQDLEKNHFYLVYVPYQENAGKFTEFLEFLIERLDYEDDVLVECVYHMYEQADTLGEVYLQEKIFADAEVLAVKAEKENETGEKLQKSIENGKETFMMSEEETKERNIGTVPPKEEKKTGLWTIFENRRKRDKLERQLYRQNTQLAMNGLVVAEEGVYQEEEREADAEKIGATVFMEETQVPLTHRKLVSPDGEVSSLLPQEDFIIGKKKDEVDMVLSDASVSRLHAKIIYDGEYYLEDMNSTNGTFKNGLRLLPYEKRVLEPGDEICCGKKVLIFR